jgi:hypothetical protein
LPLRKSRMASAATRSASSHMNFGTPETFMPARWWNSVVVSVDGSLTAGDLYTGKLKDVRNVQGLPALCRGLGSIRFPGYTLGDFAAFPVRVVFRGDAPVTATPVTSPFLASSATAGRCGAPTPRKFQWTNSGPWRATDLSVKHFNMSRELVFSPNFLCLLTYCATYDFKLVS